MAEEQGAIHFVVMKNSFKTPSVRFLKALYGCVKSALLWYNLLASTLIGMGFELNPYDSCVANKMVNGKQCTVAWYVDDNKISHVNPQVVTNVITAIEGHFGKMTVTRGPHKCLGMDITFNSDGTVGILMKDYLKGVIKSSGEPILSASATSKGLLDERVDLYGSIVTNGCAFAGQKSLHINICHCFIIDRVKTEGLNIIHCPTEEMLADFFRKPLQGALFRKFRNVILGHKPLPTVSSLSVPVKSLREERVGKDDEDDSDDSKDEDDSDDSDDSKDEDDEWNVWEQRVTRARI
ncbi:reverse transcriptase RNA-dependent DNA polymerase [Nitzschia inconspicua]|uniref:Reverse transcriptase RNA-dependent DNA polymerase n=1 Tax=Nitzschia inconspicua TaxID=303405 RepID=A0A9K3M4P0_9STRA|nr:reverse transcriptase RNA-dependent DNA polymerase [Nitzschia inconspicua]